MAHAIDTRAFCPRCAIKHLGKAKILMDEARLGYPHHVWYAMANMSEAEDELVTFMSAQATAIRRKRLRMQRALAAGRLWVPNFTRLMYKIAKEAMLEEVERRVPWEKDVTR